MTDSEVDKVLRALTDFRVDSAGRFGTLEEQIRTLAGLPIAIEKLMGRVTALELQSAGTGKFTWGDVFRVVAALAAVCVVVGAVVASVKAVS